MRTPPHWSFYSSYNSPKVYTLSSERLFSQIEYWTESKVVLRELKLSLHLFRVPDWPFKFHWHRKVYRENAYWYLENPRGKWNSGRSDKVQMLCPRMNKDNCDVIKTRKSQAVNPGSVPRKAKVGSRRFVVQVLLGSGSSLEIKKQSSKQRLLLLLLRQGSCIAFQASLNSEKVLRQTGIFRYHKLPIAGLERAETFGCFCPWPTLLELGGLGAYASSLARIASRECLVLLLYTHQWPLSGGFSGQALATIIL